MCINFCQSFRRHFSAGWMKSLCHVLIAFQIKINSKVQRGCECGKLQKLKIYIAWGLQYSAISRVFWDSLTPRGWFYWHEVFFCFFSFLEIYCLPSRWCRIGWWAPWGATRSCWHVNWNSWIPGGAYSSIDKTNCGSGTGATIYAGTDKK